MTIPIILASRSEARRSMLANAGVTVELRDHGLDERSLQQRLERSSPAGIAAALAGAKALSVNAADSEGLVIGADQTLDLEGTVLTKPSGIEAARRQLKAMAGKAHTLHSAFAIARGGRIIARQGRSARIAMRALGDAEIDAYLERAGAEVLGSVGAYRLEGLGVRLLDRIEGDYFTVLGLPLLPLLKSLRRLGAIDL